MNKQDIEKAWQRVCMWIGCTPKENTDAHEVYPLPEPYKELATDNNVVTKSGKDNNIVTLGDKIRESNESLTKYIIELLKENEEYNHSLDAQEWNTYLNQPYTE